MKGADITMIGMRTGIVFAAFTTLLRLAPIASAASTPDPLRCHAFELMCDSRYQDGMARCEYSAAHQTARDPDVVAKRLASCEDHANARHGGCLTRVHARPVCSEVLPDPN